MGPRVRPTRSPALEASEDGGQAAGWSRQRARRTQRVGSPGRWSQPHRVSSPLRTGGRRPRPLRTLFFFLLFLSPQDGFRSGSQPRPRGHLYRVTCGWGHISCPWRGQNHQAGLGRPCGVDDGTWTLQIGPVCLSMRTRLTSPVKEACLGPPGSPGHWQGPRWPHR